MPHQWHHPPHMVGADDSLPLQPLLLQEVDGGEMGLDPLFVLLQDTPLPLGIWGLFN